MSNDTDNPDHPEAELRINLGAVAIYSQTLQEFDLIALKEYRPIEK